MRLTKGSAKDYWVVP